MDALKQMIRRVGARVSALCANVACWLRKEWRAFMTDRSPDAYERLRGKTRAQLVLHWVDVVFDRAICVMGGLLFAQGPEFMQQYQQRLSASLHELRRLLHQFEDVAQQAGITLEALINRTSATPDPSVAKLGGVMESTLQRANELTNAQLSWQAASAFERPFEFLWHMDADIARRTWDSYVLAVPATVEGVFYAVVGVCVALAAYRCCIRQPLIVAWGKIQVFRASRNPAPATPES